MMRFKFLFTILLMLISFETLADQIISPPGATSWEVYVLGVSHTFRDVLVSLRDFVQFGPFQALVSTVALIGFLILLSQNMGGLDGKRLGAFFVVIAFSSYVTFSAKTNLTIIETVGVSPTSTATATEIPAAIGLPAAFVTGVGESALAGVEKFFSQPDDELKYSSHRTVNLEAQVIQDMLTVHPFSPQLTDTLAKFYEDCIYPLIVSGNTGLTIDDIMISDDLLATTKPHAQENMLGIDYTTGNVETCKNLNQKLETYTSISISTLKLNSASDHLSSDTAGTGLFLTAIGDKVLQNMNVPAGTSASKFIKNKAVASSFDQGLKNYNKSSGSNFNTFLVQGQALESKKSTIDQTIFLFTKSAAYTYTVIQLIVFGMAPFVLVMIFIPNVASKAMLSYVKVLIWLALWQPLLAIINYITASIQRNALHAEAAILMQPQGIGPISEATNQYLLASGLMATMAPVIAWMIVNGTMDFSKFAASSIGEGFASSAGASIAKGETSFDTMSGNNKSLNKSDDTFQKSTGEKPQDIHAMHPQSRPSQKTTYNAQDDIYKLDGVEQNTQVTESITLTDTESAKLAASTTEGTANKINAAITSANSITNQKARQAQANLESGDILSSMESLGQAFDLSTALSRDLGVKISDDVKQAAMLTTSFNASAGLINLASEEMKKDSVFAEAIQAEDKNAWLQLIKDNQSNPAIQQFYRANGAETAEQKKYFDEILASGLAQKDITDYTKIPGYQEGMELLGQHAASSIASTIEGLVGKGGKVLATVTEGKNKSTAEREKILNENVKSSNLPSLIPGLAFDLKSNVQKNNSTQKTTGITSNEVFTDKKTLDDRISAQSNFTQRQGLSGSISNILADNYGLNHGDDLSWTDAYNTTQEAAAISSNAKLTQVTSTQTIRQNAEEADLRNKAALGFAKDQNLHLPSSEDGAPVTERMKKLASKNKDLRDIEPVDLSAKREESQKNKDELKANSQTEVAAVEEALKLKPKQKVSPPLVDPEQVNTVVRNANNAFKPEQLNGDQALSDSSSMQTIVSTLEDEKQARNQENDANNNEFFQKFINSTAMTNELSESAVLEMAKQSVTESFSDNIDNVNLNETARTMQALSAAARNLPKGESLTFKIGNEFGNKVDGHRPSSVKISRSEDGTLSVDSGYDANGKDSIYTFEDNNLFKKIPLEGQPLQQLTIGVGKNQETYSEYGQTTDEQMVFSNNNGELLVLDAENRRLEPYLDSNGKQVQIPELSKTKTQTINNTSTPPLQLPKNGKANTTLTPAQTTEPLSQYLTGHQAADGGMPQGSPVVAQGVDPQSTNQQQQGSPEATQANQQFSAQPTQGAHIQNTGYTPGEQKESAQQIPEYLTGIPNENKFPSTDESDAFQQNSYDKNNLENLYSPVNNPALNNGENLINGENYSTVATTSDGQNVLSNSSGTSTGKLIATDEGLAIEPLDQRFNSGDNEYNFLGRDQDGNMVVQNTETYQISSVANSADSDHTEFSTNQTTDLNGFKVDFNNLSDGDIIVHDGQEYTFRQLDNVNGSSVVLEDSSGMQVMADINGSGDIDNIRNYDNASIMYLSDVPPITEETILDEGKNTIAVDAIFTEGKVATQGHVGGMSDEERAKYEDRENSRIKIQTSPYYY